MLPSSPSLALQRSLEDEEEQERERRRRHRSLSSTTDSESPRLTQNGTQRAAERLPGVEEAEEPKPPARASKEEDEDFQAILRTRKERRQRRQLVETAQAPVQESREVEAGKDSPGPEQTAQQPPVPKKEPEPLPRRRLSQKQRGPWAGMGEAGTEKEEPPEEAEAPQKTSVSERRLVPEKSAVPTKRLSSEKARVPEKGPAAERAPLTGKRCGSEESVPARTRASETSPVPEKTPVTPKTAAPQKRSPEKKPALEKASVLDKMPERRLVSERASIFEKPVASETKLAPKKAVTPEEPQAPGGSQATTGEPTGRAVPGKSTPSSAEQRVADPPTMASRLPPITLQVKIPRKDEETDTSSPTLLTYSSSLKRSSPRTISFRVRATVASVRLPASTVKLGEKLERYHTAIQRSESVRAPSNSRTEFFVAPAGVASRRHLFEKELAGQSRAEPASSRKENLRLSGVVTSRLNLWISKTQESGDQTPQEVQRETVVSRRTQWGNKPTASLDEEVSGTQ
uniref:Ladinin n=1 Tax=Jaculus jaculus TaxID=51337 RepID=A0A8C5K7N5_JACJA